MANFDFDLNVVPEEETIIPESDEQIVENNEPEPIPHMENGLAEEAAPVAEGSRRLTAKRYRRPDWLPEGWRVDVTRRSSGQSAGKYDKYYVETSTNRRFRSKNEVVNYLATGSKRKKVAPEADSTPSTSPQSQKKRKTKNKKSAGRSEADQET